MNTCSTCRYWDGAAADMRACLLLTSDGVSDTPLVVIMPAFITHRTFGCTLHEPPDDDT